MSAPINDGGAAFPAPDDYRQDGTPVYGPKNLDGMTLRDWFAGKALQGQLSNDVTYSYEWINDAGEIMFCSAGSHPAGGGGWRINETSSQRFARSCYGYADAMLEARKGGAA
ncbi:MAG: hypothetical protein V4726_05815 [Verrucomicrobiota bacterium]